MVFKSHKWIDNILTYKDGQIAIYLYYKVMRIIVIFQIILNRFNRFFLSRFPRLHLVVKLFGNKPKVCDVMMPIYSSIDVCFQSCSSIGI